MTIVEQGNGAAPQGAPPDLIKETTTQSFMKDVIEESRRQPVLVDFWAPWCGPCLMMAPEFERAAHELEPEVRLVKVNIDEEPAAARRFGVQSIPTVLLARHGRELGRLAGVRAAAELVRWARARLPPPG